MRTSLATIRTAVAVGSAVYAFTASSALGVTVFDNTPTQQALYLPDPGVEHGDEYRLSVSGLTLDSFEIQYWHSITAPLPASITVTVYANDGGVDANNGANPSAAPGTDLYTATEAIGAPGYNTFGRADLAALGIQLTDRVTIGVSFDVPQGDIGLTLSNNPEDIGWSPDDYWAKTAAGTWGTYGGPLNLNRQPVDFTARIGAVPEGSTWLSIAGIVAMAGFGAYRRFRK